ncbi:MAG TPA: GAF domain-containing protein [Dehalococcoidia bacterium]|nr:GAF domain-containing protein [Dehalococcoidia bacterium]
MTALETAPEETAPGAPAAIDAEYRALLALAQMLRDYPSPETPVEALQHVADLARELTDARYAALAVTDEHDRTEGFVTSGLTRDELRGLRTPPQAHGPLGSLRGDGRPVRISNLEQDPHAFGFPPRHPQMKTLMGVPVWASKQVRGSLYVTDKHGADPFEDEDEAILSVLALHAARVIEERWY